MAVSLEMRWFEPGNAPEYASGWFEHGLEREPGMVSTEERIDEYLPVRGCDHVGIKFRAGEDLELKLREDVFGALLLPAGIVGVPELWRKCAAHASPADDGFRGADRRTVVKRRMSRKYAYSRSGVAPVTVSTRVSAGAVVEVTALHVADVPWWSFAFEAFDATAAGETALRETFDAVVRHVLDGYSGAPLREECSYGYPHWLLSLRNGLR